ncbi:AtpZ/AtpI family protein [Rhizorhabdus dicambivorans]|uniref:ATP synthase protein I n=1 Tax=Rhizorhabdus dicambivorans TaxID=1850238 RepID=A0A2A4G061_9SPHN|nr:AtpZ/AtpI family protein [Rhizorhabdus dicambivorans]ATE66026.1 F0F1 ATP synthase assembly protein I [Rhizorhabdus dicambivorans]PCE43144.1 F0F1 ATP synthase assembly protein I [Rhizorhabdus dicambivorans]
MTENGPGQEPESVGDQRLTSLDERLRAIQHAEKVRTASAQKKPEKGYSQGNRVLTELIAGIAGGGLLGWCFDRWLGTTPWLLLVMLFLGIGVAFRNIIRISQERPE